MATKSTNIRIDERVKAEAATVFSHFGLGLSDAVNIFLRVAIDEQGLPFPLKKRDAAVIEERRSRKFLEFLGFAKENPVFPKGYKFDREACHDRESLH